MTMKIKTDECELVLDVGWLVRQGLIKAGCDLRGTLTWQRAGEEGEMRLEADAKNMDFARLKAFYGPSGLLQNSELILLQTTRPHFGGIRWWFRCPYSGKRVGKIYLEDLSGRLASREALNLAYPSQCEGSWKRALRRAQKIRKSLNGPIALGEAFPPKPKGMWWKTYRRLRESGLDCEQFVLTQVEKKFS